MIPNSLGETMAGGALLAGAVATGGARGDLSADDEDQQPTRMSATSMLVR